MSEPIAYMRDLDGTGSLHVCAKGDNGAIPVYADPVYATQAAQIEALQSALEFARDKLPGLILAVRDAPLGDSLGRANEALANGFQVINNALSNTEKK